MFRLIVFVVGIVTGVAGTLLVKNDKTKAGLKKAQASLRGVRDRFSAESAEEAIAVEAVEEAVTAKPPVEKKTPQRKPSPKSSAKHETPEGGEEQTS